MDENSWTDISPKWDAVPETLTKLVGYGLACISVAAAIGAVLALCGWIYTAITGKPVFGRQVGIGAFFLCLAIAALGGNLVAWVDWGVNINGIGF